MTLQLWTIVALAALDCVLMATCMYLLDRLRAERGDS
jgi:hypothetical protein